MTKLVGERQRQLERKREEQLTVTQGGLESANEALTAAQSENERLRALCDEMLKTVPAGAGVVGVGKGAFAAGAEGSWGGTLGGTLSSSPVRRRKKLSRPVFDIDESRKYVIEQQQHADATGAANARAGAGSALGFSTRATADPTVPPSEAGLGEGEEGEEEEEEEEGAEPTVTMTAQEAHAQFTDKLQSHSDALLSILASPPPHGAMAAAAATAPATASSGSDSGRMHLLPADGGSSPQRASLGGSNSDAGAESDAAALQQSLASLQSSLDSEEEYRTEVSLSQGTSKLQGRLKELLRTVQEEAGQSREMRAAYDAREAERLAKRDKKRK